jgi:hypothetical protein
VGCFLNLLLDYGKLFQLPPSIVASYQLAELMDSLEEWNREPMNMIVGHISGDLESSLQSRLMTT